MLQFVVGTAGTGKTHYLTNQLKDAMKAEKKAILIVPEQYSFVSERRLYRELGPESSLSLEVLSFTRLCNSIFRKFGGLAGIAMSDTSRYLLMSIAVEEIQDQLKTYRKSASNASFLSSLIAVCSEFKTAGITPLELEDFTKQADDNRLKNKLEDISLVYTTYQTLIDKGYVDSEDDLIRATETLENNDYFGEYLVFVDGFTTFMSGEFQLLEKIIAQSPKTTIALTTDSLIDEEKGTGLFAVVKQAVNRLVKYAENSGVKILEPIVMTDPVRYNNSELKKLSTDFVKPEAAVFVEQTEFIKISSAKDSYSEILGVAARIANLVRTENLKYKEIGVVARTPDDYKDIVKLLFSRYEIPYFADEKLDVEASPIIFGVISALNSVQSNFDSESMLFLAKSPIMGLEIQEVSLLENYCYSWQVRGKIWQTDFSNNPRGMVEEFTTEDSALLARINATRERIINPLNQLKKAISLGGGENFSRGIFEFLEEIGCSRNLENYGNEVGGFKGEEFLRLNATIWNSLMDVLDIFSDVLGSIKLSQKRMIELFKMAMASSEIGVIPQTLDQVLVGGADRIRPEQLKVVFVIGLNEGTFPLPISSKGMLSQSERKTLIDLGLELGGSSSHTALMERFYGYFALTLPSERLYVSYCESDLKGQKRLPSILITSLKQLFPSCETKPLLDEDYLQSKSSGVYLLAENFREDSVLRATLHSCFKEQNESLLERMNRSAWKEAHALAKSEYIRKIFGDSMRLSPSKVDRFYRCPFSYFVSDGLKLKKRQRVEFSPLESGSVIHHVLQVMMQKYGGKGLADLSLKQLEKEVEEIIIDYLKVRIQDETQLPTRTKFLFENLCKTMAKLLEHLGREFLQSLYVPTEFELAIGENEKIKPLNLLTPNGINVTVEGIVDRVDIMKKSGKTYVRVVDYKSGNKSFRLGDVLYGLNLQMLLYLFTIQEHGTGELEGAIPAGVLYMPVRESYSSVERTTSPEKAGELLRKQWSMNGLLLDDEETLKGMEEELGGVYIPAKLNKKGEWSSASSLASNEELGKLSREIKEQIKGMAFALSQGEIPSYPIDDLDYPTCSYCDYRDICGYEEGDPVRVIEKMNRQDVLELLKAKEAENV